MEPIKCKFSDFRLLAWNLTKFLLSFFKPRVSFPSVSWHIIPMKLSSWNIIRLGQKEPIKVQLKYKTFGRSIESSTDFQCHFWIRKVRVYSNFASLFSVMKENSSVKKIPSKRIFQTFEWLGENSSISSSHIWNYKSVFL